MGKRSDIRVVGAQLYWLPLQTRLPLKFGSETVTSVVCARVRLRVANGRGLGGEGWGETPLSVQWVWPGASSYGERLNRLQEFCRLLAQAWANFGFQGHPLEVGYEFQENVLKGLLSTFNQGVDDSLVVPWLAALVCCSPFDLALHDAYGQLHERPVYETYHAEFMNRDLSSYLEPVDAARTSFKSLYPADFLVSRPPVELRAWHLVGGLDAVTLQDLKGPPPKDGFPFLLEDWIRADGLKCLKVKLCGTDGPWDYQRLVQVGRVGQACGVDWLSADFNCTVTSPEYVNEILDRLRDDEPRLYGMILYVEQPFPYELEKNPLDVRSVAGRKPLFLDESAHDWRLVRLGRSLGWSGVALKTCKTQTGALLAACWARAHGMSLMVQDLTNPMLAQVPHLLLAAHVGTIMGVETNSMQFYPQASAPEAAVHPGIYRRRQGVVNLDSVRGAGFGYRLKEIKRELPKPAADFSFEARNTS